MECNEVNNTIRTLSYTGWQIILLAMNTFVEGSMEASTYAEHITGIMPLRI